MSRTSDQGNDVELSEDRRVKLTVKTLLAIIAAVAVAVGGWFRLNTGINDHDKRLAAIETVMGLDHDLNVKQASQIDGLTTTMKAIDWKLDYMIGTRRDRPPASVAGNP